MSITPRVAAIAVILAAAIAGAPTTRAKDLDGPTLLVKHRFSLNVISGSMQVYNDYLLLLPDGTAYENIPNEGLRDVSPVRLVAETAERPRDLGKWRRVAGGVNGDGIETTFTRSMYDSQAQAARDKLEVEVYQKTPNGGWSKDGKHDRWNNYAPVIALDAKRLLGPWELDEKIITAGKIGGPLPAITVLRSRNYTFYGDGKFTASASQVVSSNTTLKGADQSRFTVVTYDRSPEQAETGTYQLDPGNLALALTEADGKRRTVTAFILPNWGDPDKKSSIVIDHQRLHAFEGGDGAKPADAQQPAPAAPALAVPAGEKFGHLRFILPKGWSQSEVDGCLMLRPPGGAEKGVGILLFPAALHKGDQPVVNFENWFEATRAWLDEGRTVLNASSAGEKKDVRYPMRVQIEVVKKPDDTTQARVYVGIKRGGNAELVVMFAPDATALGEMMDAFNIFLGSITLESD